MAKSIRQSPSRAVSGFEDEWWKKYGIPVAGKGTPSDDRHWLKVGATILHLPPSVVGGMLIALVFDENRDRARRGLDRLRRQFKKTHPALAHMWGRYPSGRRSALNSTLQNAIKLAVEFGFSKSWILRKTGLADEHFDSGVDRSKFSLIDRAVIKVKRSPLLEAHRKELQALKPAQREKRILAMLATAGKS